MQSTVQSLVVRVQAAPSCWLLVSLIFFLYFIRIKVASQTAERETGMKRAREREEGEGEGEREGEAKHTHSRQAGGKGEV